jgi:hypothetical protein
MIEILDSLHSGLRLHNLTPTWPRVFGGASLDQTCPLLPSALYCRQRKGRYLQQNWNHPTPETKQFHLDFDGLLGFAKWDSAGFHLISRKDSLPRTDGEGHSGDSAKTRSSQPSPSFFCVSAAINSDLLLWLANRSRWLMRNVTRRIELQRISRCPVDFNVTRSTPLQRAVWAGRKPPQVRQTREMIRRNTHAIHVADDSEGL